MTFLEFEIVPASVGSMLGAFAPIVLYLAIIVGFFYLFALKPQKKQEREHKALIDSVEPGDSVLTSSGFYGVIMDVMDEVVIVEFGNNKNCRIPMKKEAIIEVEKQEEK